VPPDKKLALWQGWTGTDNVCITLPDPQELDFSVDLDSARFLRKRSGLVVLRDFLQDLNFQHELERQLHQAAQEMLRDEKLMPSREELVDRLNRIAPTLTRISHRQDFNRSPPVV